jgi:xanthine/uracil permease
MSIASVALGIASVLSFLFSLSSANALAFILPPTVTGVLAIVLGLIVVGARRNAPQLLGEGTALAGIVLGVLGLAGYVLMVFGHMPRMFRLM